MKPNMALLIINNVKLSSKVSLIIFKNHLKSKTLNNKYVFVWYL